MFPTAPVTFIKRLVLKKALLIAPLLVLLSFPQVASANTSWSVNFGVGDRGHSRGRHHEEPRHHYLPRGACPIGFRGHQYFYYDGVYYQGVSGGYTVVSAPRGVIVSSIPWGHHRIWMNGRYYFRYQDTYYVPIQGGYQVVDSPYAASVSNNLIAVDEQENLVINIPNSQGGFTPIALKRSGTGFLGPQGEYYSEFPKVAQLKAMYVK